MGVTEPLRLERDVFQVRRGELDVIVSTPLDSLAEQLIEQFPSERAGIETVVGVLRDLVAAFGVLRPEDLTSPGPWTTPDTAAVPGDLGDERRAAWTLLRDWGGVPAGELLDRHIRDPRLRDLLGSQGVSEPTMPVVLLARMWDFMAERGIWYPVDGVDTVGRLLAGRLTELGGDLRLRSRVATVLIEGGRAVGVRLNDRSEIRAGTVISDADYRHTLLELLPPGSLDAAQQAFVDGLPLTASVFAVFLGVRSDRVDLSAFRGHQLLVKLQEGPEVPWAEKRPSVDDFLTDELWLCWWSRHSAPQTPLAPPGREALVIKVMAPVAPFLKLDGQGRRRHLAAYYLLKEQLADAVVAAAERVLPGLGSAVEVREVATPLTYRDWGHRSLGSVAGWSWRAGDVPEPWAQDLVVTPVPGLLAVGLQSYTRLFLGGMGTSVYSGGYAASMVPGPIPEG